MPVFLIDTVKSSGAPSKESPHTPRRAFPKLIDVGTERDPLGVAAGVVVEVEQPAQTNAPAITKTEAKQMGFFIPNQLARSVRIATFGKV